MDSKSIRSVSGNNATRWLTLAAITRTWPLKLHPRKGCRFTNCLQILSSRKTTSVKPELVRRCICLLNMLLDWLTPKMAVTERFVRVGIRAGYRWWIIYWKKSPLPWRLREYVGLLAGCAVHQGGKMETGSSTEDWLFILGLEILKKRRFVILQIKTD